MCVLCEITTKIIRIVSLKLESLVPNETVCTELRSPVELDEGTLSFGVDEYESVDTETLDHTVGTRDGVVGKSKDTHEERIGSQRQPIVERVVSSLGLRKVKLRFRFGGVDEIDELNTILHCRGVRSSVSVRSEEWIATGTN